ncbi:DUF4835 family protein [Rubrivirga litoralis]|uniref:DUF4835 family protein n=1 Tax=Rubrivirga litoralis TaxID=3075598 RepID=A0ABU3BMY3_9BACT|nr:DUF4835 family protein [Rubrivirga sp. F394]MDT0630638.1 DUF4835 family protein [Rubrivirga sp. F394]
MRLMPWYRFGALLVLAVALAAPAAAQELNCVVSINRQAVPGSEYEFLDELRTEVARYLNDRAWTEDRYQADEQIDCDVQITIRQAVTLSTFSAQIVVQSSRPVYGTAQRTTLLAVPDAKWTFGYTRGQALVYDPNRYNSLTSVLDFYANLMLGYDYDSFAPLGGTVYFERARQTAELARGAIGATDWQSDRADEQTRSLLIQEVLNPTFEPLRRAMFTYHYTVLDHFLVEPEVAWVEATAMLGRLHELFLLSSRRRYVTDLFYAAKYQELTDLLIDAPQRNEAYALLSEMDPSHLATYDALVSGR